jgi:predicted MPP superfamily phosphohydrolase
MSSINWLHLSDLHRGMTAQKYLWTNIESEFFDDLSRLHELSGPWDIIFFTGDLTQRGTADEFTKLSETLERLYQHLRALGSNPTLLTVPGNHDLQRPNKLSPGVKVLKDWQNNKDIHHEFWSNKDSEYRRLITDSFKSYSKWLDTNPFPKPRIRSPGILPGDFSALIEKDGLKIGVVGLNIAFLQLTEGDYQGKLATHPIQLTGVLDENFNDWFKVNDINFLMTHQPPDWLDSQSLRLFDGEINKPGRFVAHLYGHMHEPRSYSQTTSGAKPKRYLQACSLFGMETYGESSELKRLHGYAAGKIQFQNDRGEILLWPRKAEDHHAGHLHIVPDPNTTLEKDGKMLFGSVIRTRMSTNRLTDTRRAKPIFRVLILSTDIDLGEAKRNVSDYLTKSLGVEVDTSSGLEDFEWEKYDLIVHLQGWWWDGGHAASTSKTVPESKRLNFVVDDESDWPPRRLSEATADSEIKTFIGELEEKHIFRHPDDLPEMIGELVTNVLQAETGNDVVGLFDWERAYLSFRLPAWQSGRTASSSGHLLEEDGAEELYQADLYVALDGTSSNWKCGKNGRPTKVRKKKEASNTVEETDEKRVRLGHWASVTALPRLVIVGAPGGGKTVFLTRIASALANACLGRVVDFEPDLEIENLRMKTGRLPIPVIVEATKIASNKTIDISGFSKTLAEEISAAGLGAPNIELIQEGLKRGRYLLLIDALDEIADTAERSQVLNLLKGMASEAIFPNARIILTTRSARYTGKLRFAPEFETVEVAGLNFEQISKLCVNWSHHRKRDGEYTKSLMSAVNGLSENVGSTAEDQAITENPLMLTAICMVFEKYRSLPDDRGRLCELLIDDLCRSRTSEDQQYGWKLDDSAKKDLLQRIAHAMQVEGAQTWPVRRAIEIAMTLVPSEEKFQQQRAKKYLDWAADHTGLLRFQQDAQGEEHIRFWHRLFREYLCATRLAQLDKTATDLVDQLWNEERLTNPFWEDVVRLLPGALGTIEKARILRQKLTSLANENNKNQGRLLALRSAGIIENRLLYPDVDVSGMAKELARIYERASSNWPLRDRLLYLEGLGRLDPQLGDPRLFEEHWTKIPTTRKVVHFPDILGPGVSRKTLDALLKKLLPVEEFRIAWTTITVQEFRKFLDAADFALEEYWNFESLPGFSSIATYPDKEELVERLRSQFRFPNRPVVRVSLLEAEAYCRWRSKSRSDGLRVNLPTMVDWICATNYATPLIEADDKYQEELMELRSLLVPVGTVSLLKHSLHFPGEILQWCRPTQSDYVSKYKLTTVFGHEIRRNKSEMGFIGVTDSLEFRHPIIGFRCVLTK